MSEKRDIGVYLEDILESIRRIETYSKGMTPKDLMKQKDLQDAIVFRFEVIGEAAKHIPKDFQKKYPDVPWREIAKTRDKIIHYYFEIDLNYIWNIIHDDLMLLKKQIKEILKNLDED